MTDSTSLHRSEPARYVSFSNSGFPRLISSRHCKAKLGVDRGPIHLVEAGLEQQLKDLGWQVQFDGHHQFEEISAESDPPIGKMKNPRFVSQVCKSVSGVVSNHARRGQLPVVLGGDHSLVRIYAYIPIHLLIPARWRHPGNGHDWWNIGVSPTRRRLA